MKSGLRSGAVAPVAITGESSLLPLLQLAPSQHAQSRSASSSTGRDVTREDSQQGLLQATEQVNYVRKKSVAFMEDDAPGAAQTSGRPAADHQPRGKGASRSSRRVADLWNSDPTARLRSRRKWRRLLLYARPRYWLYYLNKRLPIVHPENPWRRAWDMLLLLLIAYSLIMIPYQVGFGRGMEDGFLITDQVVDVIFWLDLFSNFRVAFWDDQGILVRDGKRCASHYLRGWFCVDLCATVPLDQIVRAAVTDLTYTQDVALAMLRLPRLLRIGRLMRFFDRIKGSNLLRFVRLLFVMTVAVHFVACSWFLLYRLVGPDHEFSFSLLRHPSATTYYLNAYLQSFLLMIGNDVAPIADIERLFCTLILIMGACFYAIIVGTMSMLINNLNPTAARHKFKQDSITNTIRYLGASESVKARVAAYYDYLSAYSHPGPEGMALINSLPPSMNQDFSRFTYRELVTAVPLFQNSEEPFLSQLVMRLKLSVYLPGEVIFSIGDVGHEMFFVVKGHVAVMNELGEMLAVLHQGGFFGELALLATARRTARCVALCHCDLAVLNRGDLMAAMRDFPVSAQNVRDESARRINHLQAAGTIGEVVDTPGGPTDTASLRPSAAAGLLQGAASHGAIGGTAAAPVKDRPGSAEDVVGVPGSSQQPWISPRGHRRGTNWDSAKSASSPREAAALEHSDSAGKARLPLPPPDAHRETLDLLEKARQVVEGMSGRVQGLQGRVGVLHGRIVQRQEEAHAGGFGGLLMDHHGAHGGSDDLPAFAFEQPLIY